MAEKRQDYEEQMRILNLKTSEATPTPVDVAGKYWSKLIKMVKFPQLNLNWFNQFVKKLK